MKTRKSAYLAVLVTVSLILAGLFTGCDNPSSGTGSIANGTYVGTCGEITLTITTDASNGFSYRASKATSSNIVTQVFEGGTYTLSSPATGGTFNTSGGVYHYEFEANTDISLSLVRATQVVMDPNLANLRLVSYAADGSSMVVSAQNNSQALTFNLARQ